MLQLFDRRKVFGVPAAFLNAVAKWIWKLHSPRQTITIDNDTSGDGGAGIDINPEGAAKAMEPVLDARYMVRDDPSVIDSLSMQYHKGRLSVRHDWIVDLIKIHIRPDSWVD